MGLLRSRRAAEDDRAERLEAAQRAGRELDQAAERADSQVSFVNRLMRGWKEVHAANHLAELFREEYGRTRE
jgi:hypothetical protein